MPRLQNAKFPRRIRKHFLRKEKQILKLFKNYFPILEIPLNLIGNCQKRKSNLLFDWLLAWSYKIPNLTRKCKIIFSHKMKQSLRLPENVLLIFNLLGIYKNLNRLGLVNQHWYKAQKCEISSTNTNPFLSGSEANLETLKKVFLHIGVSYKFLLKSAKSVILTF